MGLIKPNDYTNDQVNFSEIGKALAHPARQRILMILQEEQFVRPVDLTRVLNLNAATIHKHLHFLYRAQLITSDYRIHESLLKLDFQGLQRLEMMTKRLTQKFRE